MQNKTEPPALSIYFGVALWGKRFCDEFMDNCLASLLAEGNIPSLHNHNNSNRFVFCTTHEDWAYLQTHSNFVTLNRYIKAELLPLDLVSEEDYTKQNRALPYKFYMVTRAHKALTSHMYTHKAIGALLFPDTIFATGALQSALKLLGEKKAVLAHFPRLASDEFIEALKIRGHIQAKQPIAINGRHLIRIAMQHMNIEVLAQRWDIPYAFSIATEIWEPLHNNIGMLFHSLAWCPVFINYSKLEHHDTACLEDNTIDGAYLYKNLSIDDCHVITDSDDYVMISYSPQTKLTPYKIPQNVQWFNHDFNKINHWRHFIKNSWGSFTDPLKLELLKQPIYWHTENLICANKNLQKKTTSLVNKILKLNNLHERVLKKPIDPYSYKEYIAASLPKYFSISTKNKLTQLINARLPRLLSISTHLRKKLNRAKKKELLAIENSIYGTPHYNHVKKNYRKVVLWGKSDLHLYTQVYLNYAQVDVIGLIDVNNNISSHEICYNKKSTIKKSFKKKEEIAYFENIPLLSPLEIPKNTSVVCTFTKENEEHLFEKGKQYCKKLNHEFLRLEDLELNLSNNFINPSQAKKHLRSTKLKKLKCIPGLAYCFDLCLIIKRNSVATSKKLKDTHRLARVGNLFRVIQRNKNIVSLKKLKKISGLASVIRFFQTIKHHLAISLREILRSLTKRYHLIKISYKKKLSLIQLYLQGINLIHEGYAILKKDGLSSATDYISKRYTLYSPPPVQFLKHMYQYFSELELNHMQLPLSNRKKYLIHFCVWGERYGMRVKNYLLPSLLAKYNLPYISEKYEVTLLIHCDKETKESLNNSPVINQIQKFAHITFLTIPSSILTAYKKCFSYPLTKHLPDIHHFRYYLLGGLQAHALKIALKYETYVTFLMPDVVLSDNFLKVIFEKIENKKIVLTTTTRTNYQDVYKKLDLYYHDPIERTSLSIPSQTLTELQISHLHFIERRLIVSENTEHFVFSGRLIFESPTGFIIRAFHYHPILLNCEHVKQNFNLDYLPIDDSTLYHLLEKDMEYNQQVWVCDNSATMSLMELSDNTMKPPPNYNRPFHTYDELVELAKKSIFINAPGTFNSNLNQYFITFRHAYISGRPQKNKAALVDDQCFINDVYRQSSFIEEL